MTKNAIAHYRQFDRKVQPVKEHLYGVSSWSGKSASKIDLPSVGQLLGLLHDLGKYSAAFQKYILSAIGMLNPDVDDEYVDFAGLKGKIDHSTAGAQWIWNRFHHYGAQGQLAGRILAICLASHHGGLIDCLRPDGTDGFRRRITKDDAKTHFEECVENADPEIIHRLEELATKEFLKNFLGKIVDIVQPDKKESELVKTPDFEGKKSSYFSSYKKTATKAQATK